MQQRGSINNNNNNKAETEVLEEQTSPPQSRGRISNSKSKVLVRSHAMREEASPPREPTPTSHRLSPSIKLTRSPVLSPVHSSTQTICTKPLVVLSPSPTCISPTSTIVPSPDSRYSPQPVDVYENECPVSPKFINTLNKQNLEECKVVAKTEIIVEETSQCCNRRKSERCNCNCTSQNCINCFKNQERNINNNLSSNINNNVVCSSNTLTVGRASVRGKLKQQSSSHGSFEGSSSNSPCLSRDSSSEQYTDTTGVDLEQFIPETLNRNSKDRALMLRIEQELVNLAKDKLKTHYKFPPMSSYQRMLVHRCAAYFGMDHNIESSGKCVVVNKTKNTRIPDVEFKEHIKEDIIFSEEPRRSILKRDSNSVEEYSYKSPDRQMSFENRRSKSFEEREEEYEKVRRRIFNRELHDGSSAEEFPWAEIPWSSTDSENSSRFRLHPPEHHHRPQARLLKVQSEDTGETLRPCVAKSYSFGGYGGVSVLTRGDSVMSTHSAGARLLTKQDSAASSVSWRLSPSSSGYKSQSQRSESITPSPTSTPNLSSDTRQDSSITNVTECSHSSSEHSDTQLVWAVTDIHSVPKGSIIINPQTGQPVKNEDGSLYHYDPSNLPPGLNSTASKPPQSPQKIISSPQKVVKDITLSPKKRSRSSPCKKLNVTNSSTSPSLPFTPPLAVNRNFQFMPVAENVTNMPQQFSVYGGSYTGLPPPPSDNSLIYPTPPCIVYTPYNVPVQHNFDGRIESHLSSAEVTPGGYYIDGSSGNVQAQPMSYQPTGSYWNQPPVTYFPNATNHVPQRYPVPVPTGQPGFISTAYTSSFIPQPPQTPQSSELIPVYQQQPVQMIYQPQVGQSNPVMYPNQPPPPPAPIIYTQNPMFQAPVYPAQSIPPPYPQNTSTPNSCTSSISNTAYCSQVQEINQSQHGYTQLSQSMAQLNLNSNQMNLNQMPVYSNKFPTQQYDVRQKSGTPKGNKFSTPKNFMCSSQNSTGTNSPATTVVAGYCGGNTGGIYRTPPDTPPTTMPFAYGHPFMPPVFLRQVSSNIRTNTPGTNRSSRSPTPASDVPHIDRQRISYPPTLYQGMPYVLQPDNRMISGRGQPSAYRQQNIRQQNVITPTPDSNGSNRSHKGRKSRGNKMSGLPPNGKLTNQQ